jgi:hypothetical protein
MTSAGLYQNPVRTSFVTSNGYESFDLTFKSDILSTKSLEFFAGDETFKFNIGPNGFKIPFTFDTNTSQKKIPSYNSFIADGLQYARTRDKGTAYEKLKPLLDESYDIFTKLTSYSTQATNPLVPEWLNTLLGEFATEFLNGEDNDYYFGKVNSIYACNDVLKDNPYTGASGATYGIESLGRIIADIDSSNFSEFKDYFEAASYLYGVSGNSILTFGETKIVERFNCAVETAMSKSGYTFLNSGTAKKNFINQLLKFYTMEYLVSTDYTISENLNTTRNESFEPAYTMSGANQRRTAITDLLDYSKVDTYSNDTGGATLITQPIYYTANSVFKVSYDTHMLSFYVDSKLIHEFSVYSEELMKIKLIANTIDTPRLSVGTYGFRNISLGENSDPSILLKRKIKQLTATKLSTSDRQSYLEKILKMNLIPGGSSMSLGSNEDLYFETVNTDINYFYTISQFTKHTELLKLCGTRIVESDVPTYPTFSQSDYLTTFNASTIITELKEVAEFMRTDSTASVDDIIFLQFQASVISYLSSVVSNGVAGALTYSIEDNYNISDTYVQLQNLYAKKKLLTNTEASYPTSLPPIIGKSLLLNEYSTDIENKLDQSQLKSKLGGALTCNFANMFGSTLLFNNTSVGSTLYNFLEEIKGLTGLAPLTYEKIFIEVQNAIGISLVAEKIMVQNKLLNPYSKFINYLKTETLFIPEDNKQLDNEIINYFYGPVGSIPSNAYLPILGVSYSNHSSTPVGTDLCIYDKTFPSELKYLYDINFSKNFPNVYDGMKLWFPLQNALTDISYSQSYMKAMHDLRTGTNLLDISDLDVDHYKNILLAYNSSVLPVASNPLDESGLFGQLVVPRIRETLQDTFKLDIGNNNKYFTDDELALFKKHLVQGSTGDLYNGITGGSTGLANRFYDLNSVYVKLADDYDNYINNTISILIAAVDTDPTFDSVGNLIKTVVSGGTGLTGLNEYRRAKGALDGLETTYRSMLGVPFGSSGNTGGLYAFDQYFTAYQKFDDSRVRWSQMMTDLYRKDGPNTDIGSFYSSMDFIVSIPPTETSRWTAITGNTISSYNTTSEIAGISGTTVSYGDKSFSRYNSYWKYFQDDIVSYNGQLYQCTDTERFYNTVNIPPGQIGNQQRMPGLFQALTPTITDPTGPSGGTLTYGVSQDSTALYIEDVGISSLYAWEEWHYIPGLSGTTSITEYLKNPPDEKDRNFQGYPEETQYVLMGSSGGVDYPFDFLTNVYSPLRTYYGGELVKWNNSLYRCRGGLDIIRGFGIGQPPNFTNTNTSWTLIGSTQTTDNIEPGSNGVWKLVDSLNTAGNIFLEKAFPEYNSEQVYNIGDYVTYLGKRYQRLANGTVALQDGTTGTITRIPPATSDIVRDSSWIAQPYIDLTREGKNIPEYDSIYPYSNGDIVVHNNLVYKNILNSGSTGLYVEGSEYAKGDVIIAYEGYKFVSLKDNNTDDPPYPRSGSSIFWTLVAASPIQPPTVPAYNFQKDYNLEYHTSGGQQQLVWYDESIYAWKDPLNINYSVLDPALSNLYQYGLVKNIEPPLPEPFNSWIVTTENNGNSNPLKGNTAIFPYDSRFSYNVDDIVYYYPGWENQRYYFKCTGNGYGNSKNEDGDIVPTQLYISAKEVNYGRALKDPFSQTRYNEIFVVSENVNDEITSIPKWGEGRNDDPWAAEGFCRNLRYKLASGLELTTLTLKYDKDVFNDFKPYRTNFTGKPFVNYLKTLPSYVVQDNVLTGGNFSPYTDPYIDTNYKNAEFYYYSYFLRELKYTKETVGRLNAQINQVYGRWLDVHETYLNQAVQEYLMNDALKPSISGIPLYMEPLKINPFPSDGFFSGGIDELKREIKRLNIEDLFARPLNIFVRGKITQFPAGELLIHGKTNPPGGLTGLPGIKYNADGVPLVPFTYFDSETTGNYGGYYFEKTIETITEGSASIFIPGYTAATAIVGLNLAGIDNLIGLINCKIGYDKLVRILARKNTTDFYQSWYRNQIAIKTGMTEYPILVPIMTSQDKEYCKYDFEKIWEGTSDLTVRSTRAFKKNVWYTGSQGHLLEDLAFGHDDIWMQESFNPDVKGVDGQTGPEYKRYIFEPVHFDLKPNYYRFQEVEDTYAQLFGTTLAPSGITLVNASNYSYWDNKVTGSTGQLFVKPFGSIDRNVGQWAKDKDWPAENFNPASGALTPVRKAQAFWGDTRYSEKSQISISESDLFYYQGKKPFKKNQNYMSILQYVIHIKKCSQLEASSALPPRFAEAIKKSGFDQEYASAFKKLLNDMRILLIVVISLVLVVAAIASGGSALAAASALAGPGLAGLSALIFSVGFAKALVIQVVIAGVIAGCLTGLTLGLNAGIGEKNNPLTYIFGMLSDPGKLMFPDITTDVGLITRCQFLEQFMSQTNEDSYTDNQKLEVNTSVFKTFSEKLVNPVTYQEYFYAKNALYNLYETYSTQSFKSTEITDFGTNIGHLQLLGTMGISGSASIKALIDKLPDEQESYLYLNELYSRVIADYEQQLFFPIVYRDPPIDRDATLQITYLQWEPDFPNAGGTGIQIGNTGPRPSGFDGVCYVKINIEDPGEGFYEIDESGNKVPYIYNNPAPNITTFSLIGNGVTGATFTVEDLYLVGKYCYDDTDPTKTAVKGLATFNHFDNETIGFNGKIAINWSGGPEIIGSRFKIPFPPKQQMPTTVANTKFVPIEYVDGSGNKFLYHTAGRASGQPARVEVWYSTDSKFLKSLDGNPELLHIARTHPNIPGGRPQTLVLHQDLNSTGIQGSHFDGFRANMQKGVDARIGDTRVKGILGHGERKFSARDLGPAPGPRFKKPTPPPPRPPPKWKTPGPPPLPPRGLDPDPNMVQLMMKAEKQPPGPNPATIRRQNAMQRPVGKETEIRLPEPYIPKPYIDPTRPPGLPAPVYAKAAGGLLGIIGAGVDIYFAVKNIEDAMKSPPPSTNCTDLSNRGNN